MSVGLDVAEGVVDGEAEFPVLQHRPAVCIDPVVFHQLRPEERVAIEKDGGEPHEHSVLFADLVDGILNDLQVVIRFLGGGRTEGQGFEEELHRLAQALVGDVIFLHKIMNGRHRAGDLGAVNNRRGQTAQVALRLHLVVGLGVVGDLLGQSDQAHRSIGHVFQNVLGFAHDLRGFGAVNGVEVRIIFEAMLAGGGQHHRYALHGRSVGDGATFPAQDAVGAEVEFQLAAVIGGHHITARALAGTG